MNGRDTDTDARERKLFPFLAFASASAFAFLVFGVRYVSTVGTIRVCTCKISDYEPERSIQVQTQPGQKANFR